MRINLKHTENNIFEIMKRLGKYLELQGETHKIKPLFADIQQAKDYEEALSLCLVHCPEIRFEK